MSEERWVKGLKEHQCNYCGERIAKGVVHYSLFLWPAEQVDGDYPYTFRLHAICNAAWNWYHDENDLAWDETAPWGGEFVSEVLTPWMAAA